MAYEIIEIYRVVCDEHYNQYFKDNFYCKTECHFNYLRCHFRYRTFI